MDPIWTRPWPWYVAGPLIGFFCPLLLVVGNKLFGFSSNLRHACAATFPAKVAHFRYDWRREGAWNLVLALGVLVGGFVAGKLLANPEPVAIAASTRADLGALGFGAASGLAPPELFGWKVFTSAPHLVVIVLGGLLVGFGSAYAGGCTSGHGLAGVAALERASFLALVSFFVGGILGTFVILPWLL